MTAAADPVGGTLRTRPMEFVLATLGFVAIVFALPFVLLLGGSVTHWALGAALFTGSWAAQQFISKVALSLDDPTQAVGLIGISSIGRAVLVVMILFVIAAKVDETMGLVAAGVFAGAFTFDLMGRSMLHALRDKGRKAERKR